MNVDISLFDIINLVVAVIGIIVAIVTFSIQEIKSRRENRKRATMSDFREIRNKYAGFWGDIKGIESEEEREDKISSYLNDLTRFSAGFLQKLYDIDLICEMSGIVLLSEYHKFYNYIPKWRQEILFDFNYRGNPERTYRDYIEFIKYVHKKRKKIFYAPEKDYLKKFYEVNSNYYNKRLRKEDIYNKESMVYIPGDYENKFLVIVHLGTEYKGIDVGTCFVNNIVNHGHSVLVIKSNSIIMNDIKEIQQEIDKHRFALDIDFNGNSTYQVINDKIPKPFINYIEDNGFRKKRGLKKNIEMPFLKNIPGVRIDVGCFKNKSHNEDLVCDSFVNSFTNLKNVLNKGNINIFLKIQSRG